MVDTLVGKERERENESCSTQSDEDETEKGKKDIPGPVPCKETTTTILNLGSNNACLFGAVPASRLTNLTGSSP